MFTLFGATVTIWQILAAIPEVIQIVKDGSALVSKLRASGKTPQDAANEALGLTLKAIGAFAAERLGILNPHAMTPAERELWFDRAKGSIY